MISWVLHVRTEERTEKWSSSSSTVWFGTLTWFCTWSWFISHTGERPGDPHLDVCCVIHSKKQSRNLPNFSATEPWILEVCPWKLGNMGLRTSVHQQGNLQDVKLLLHGKMWTGTPTEATDTLDTTKSSPSSSPSYYQSGLIQSGLVGFCTCKRFITICWEWIFQKD